MVKRVCIAGCRDYDNYSQAKEYMDFCLCNLKRQYELVIISGGCAGADKLGERYAAENDLPVERYPAQWDIYGKAAGPKRNQKLAELCDYVICFWDGKSRGTKTMIEYATALGKPIRVKRI